MPELYKNKFHIESTRLPGYDYSQPGYYFVTICTKYKFCYFGEIVDEKMVLNNIGKIAVKYWLEIPKHFLQVTLDEFVIMPNHVHGIVEINENCRDEALPRLYINATEPNINIHQSYTGQHPQMSQISPKPNSLSTIIGSYKSICTKTINQLHGNNYFAWQSRFYDHIIKNDQALFNIRQYIINNPQIWNRDRNNEDGLLV